MRKAISIGCRGASASTCPSCGMVQTAPTIGQISQHQAAWVIQKISHDQRRMYFCGA